MATQINCNELSQVALELQMKFQNCTKLKAEDLDTLVDLITSIGYCVTSGTYNQNNIIKNIDILNVPNTDSISSIINNRTLFTINDIEIYLFSLTRNNNNKEIYLFKLGKGSYGNGSTITLTDSDFILLNESQSTIINNIPDSIISDGNTNLELKSGSNILSTVDLCPIVNKCIDNSDPLISVAIDIDNRTCSVSPNPLNESIFFVYVLKKTSEVNSGIITLNNNDILYSDALLTIPFNGNNLTYIYNGIAPNYIHSQEIIIDATGNIISTTSCDSLKKRTLTFSGVLGQNITSNTFLIATDPNSILLLSKEITSIIIKITDPLTSESFYNYGLFTLPSPTSFGGAGINEVNGVWSINRFGSSKNVNYEIKITYNE